MSYKNFWNFRFVYDGKSADFKSPELAVGVYRFARKWMILHLVKAVEKFLEKIRPEDALKVLEHFVDEENSISARSLKVIWLIISDLCFDHFFNIKLLW